EPLAIPLDEIHIDEKLNFIEEPIEIMEREVKRLKQSGIPIVKVRWNSRRGPEYTWEREDQMQKKYPHLFAKPLLYLDSTIFPDLRVLRHRPALRSWNTTTMRKRIKMETETRRLGKLEHHGEFNHEEEQDGINVYKGLDVYVPPINDKEPETKEEFYEKIIEKFHKIMEERLVLVRTLTDGVAKFEHDQTMLDFCKEYKQTFNDAEFNLYESSNDEDSEGDVDGDNDKNNNNDDDGAPTADANKKKESENQKKKRNKEEIDKQTEESGSKGTEENGSEATEGGSDGKEENMNGDEREVTAQMDVDNQNKELNKEKDANETEDNDKMNNNDMKNDSVQEKQDTDKDENAKVDNVEEKQGDHKDEIGEDEFWNTQFTDSQCEEMENQAKEEIKKKIAKRKTVIEMTPPSFSLGLSPNTNKVEERAEKRVNNRLDLLFLHT
ncbi:hypothetical protein Tco_0785056, partial [Tanacetum coccineum]